MNLLFHLSSDKASVILTTRHVIKKIAKRQAKAMVTAEVPGEKHGVNL